MKNFFSLSSNSKVGYKCLSEADLGLGARSNQTHIGLFQNTLNFDNAHKTVKSKLLYGNKSFDRVCFLDFIENQDGSYRSPKIRTGNTIELSFYGESIVREIRNIVKNEKNDRVWFLIWFELNNGEFIFYLISEKSSEYDELRKLIPDLVDGGAIDASKEDAKPLLKFLEIKTELSNLDYLKDLELLVQVGQIDPKITKPRRIDIEKAMKQLAETGRKGEELVAEHLSKLKFSKAINDFEWVNKSKESSFPYDFEINHDSSKKVFMDVKTTSYTFEQEMVFSNSEIKFMSQNKNYYIYRVYDLTNSSPSLRICQDTHKLSISLNKDINEFKKTISFNDIGISSMKFQVAPTNKNLKFENQIILLS